MVGIGGVGMSGIAQVLLGQGVRVTGSDAAENDLIVDIRSRGATIHIGHQAENVGAPDVVAYSTAIRPDNPELAFAREHGIPLAHRSELLAYAVRDQGTIAVAGTHGKTSTSCMLTHVLVALGEDPTALVGGIEIGMGSNARLGKGRFAVVEACESDRSFLNFRPAHAILTNIEADHLDSYSGIDDIIASFEAFLALIPQDGLLIACADRPNARGTAERSGKRVVTYSVADAQPAPGTAVDYVARDGEVGADGTSFRVDSARLGHLGAFRTRLVGRHYVGNATAIIALCTTLGMDREALRGAIASFRGVSRRFELLGTRDGAVVYDDYAHHPTEIRATLRAAKEGLQRRLIAVFQPHLFSRTVHLLDEFATAFGDADLVFIADIYGSREGPTGPITGAQVAERVRDLGRHADVTYVSGHGPMTDAVAARIEPGDAVFVLGAGDIRSVGLALVRGSESA